MTYEINLQWLVMNVDMNTVHAWMQANAGSNYVGISANDRCQIHFSANPGEDVIDAVNAYWAGLNSGSAEATNYQPVSARAAASATNLASAQAKLAALGLTSAEIAALIGS